MYPRKKIIPVLFPALFAAVYVSLAVGFFLEAIEFQIRFLFLRYFILGMSAWIFQRIENPRGQILIILIIAALFSALCFPLTLFSFLAGALSALFCLWLGRFLENAEAGDLVKLTLPVFLVFLLGLIFFGWMSDWINQNGLLLFIEMILFLSYLNINDEKNTPASQGLSHQRIMNAVLFALMLLVYLTNTVISQALLMLISVILSLFSYLLALFVDVFSFVFLFLAKIIVSLLSKINFFASADPSSTDTVLNPQAETVEEWMIETEGNAPWLSQLFKILAVVFLILLFIFIIKRLLYQFSLRRQDRTITAQLHRSSQRPKKASFLHRRKEAKKEAALSSIRKRYRNAVNELIQKDHPYLISMTPLEYLQSLPDEAKDEEFTALTESYNKARYRDNE